MLHKRTHSFAVLILCSLLAACNLPSAVPAQPPATAVYSNFVLDCRTANPDPELVQPPGGCDRWQDNRYERPFNAQTQDTYYPDLDIVFSALGQSRGWFFTRIGLQSLRPQAQVLSGSYGIEIDTDQDRRGDYLIAGTPQVNPGQDWSPVAVQAWYDSNNDVGNHQPGQPDGPYAGNGYDQLITGQDTGKDANAFMRVREQEGHVYLELAFKAALIGNPQSFYWWSWADAGVRKLNGFDYQDTFDLPTAGEVYAGSQYFPARSIAAVDDTCIDTFGGESPQGDAQFCRGDPSVAYVPPGGNCEDPVIQGDVIVCVPAGDETVTATATCPPNTISFDTPTPGGPPPCGSHPPCVQLVILGNTPDPNRCTPTATPGFGTPPADCPTPALVRGPANTVTPGGPTPCFTFPPCTHLTRLGEPSPTPGGCTPTPPGNCPTLSALGRLIGITVTPGGQMPCFTATPPANCPTLSALGRLIGITVTPGGTRPCVTVTPCSSFSNSAAAANAGGCTPTPTCPVVSLSTHNNAAPCVSATPCASFSASTSNNNTAGCTPTATPPPSDCPTLSFSRGPVATYTPGGPTPCYSFPPCIHLTRAGAPTATPGGCTPTPTICPPASFSTVNATPCAPSTPCAGLSNSAGAANTAGCTPTPTPTCPANSLSSSAAANSPAGCPTATRVHITFTPRPTRKPHPTDKPTAPPTIEP